ncbi:MAG TPA: ParB/RepB/Spo0J family partition protein [Verrucomicrobiae bacterium]|nr:ParB/RepB/Spo0J family partition protein [Verrucomicrobiae bacterium]
MAKGDAALQEIDPDIIKPNPDNPRLIFHEDEMNELLESIREVGVKVPISVYADGSTYVLLDGERRWRCSRRLNLDAIPALVQPKPTRLENLLMMFNIHNVRVDWDIMPMALKLREVRDMLVAEGKPSGPKELAGITGVRLTSIRRALELLDLPQHYQKLLLKEAEKPREQQRIKADLFIEVYKSLHAIERHIPEVFETVTKTQYIDAMVKKYVSGVIDNVVGFREVSKIARAELAGVSKQQARPAIIKLVKRKGYGIDEAFRDTVEAAYEQRDLTSKLDNLTEKLTRYKSSKNFTKDVCLALARLRTEINRLIGRSG